MPRTHPSQCKQPLTELLSPNTLVFLSLLFLSSLNPFRSPRDLCRQPWELLEPNPMNL